MFKKKKTGKSFLDSDIMHYLRFAAIPVIAVILIAVIIRSDSGKGREESQAQTEGQQAEAVTEAAGGTVSEEMETPDESGTEEGESLPLDDAEPDDAEQEETESETVASEPETVSYEDIDISQLTLKQDEVPELSALVRTYCQAREEQDVELLARLYGVSGLSEDEIAEEREKLELVHASIRSYENITCYSIEGPEPDSYVIFPYFELNYREAEVNMPQLTWAYVTKIEDGSYIMTQEISQPVAEYIARIGELEEVKALRNQVEEARAAAIEADGKLKSIYGGEESEVVIS